jgi:hypothetical protein
MGVQEVRWEKGRNEPEDIFFCGNGNANQYLRANFFIYKRSGSP